MRPLEKHWSELRVTSQQMCDVKNATNSHCVCHGPKLGQLKSDGLASLLFLTLILNSKSNQAADSEPLSKVKQWWFQQKWSDEYETVSYTMVCDYLNNIIKGENLSLEVTENNLMWENKELPDQEKTRAVRWWISWARYDLEW